MIHALLACLILGSAAAPGGGDDDKEKTVVVQCKADAQVRGTDILLRDVAEIRTHDPELTQRLAQVTFGKRPAFGFNRVLSRQDITMRLLREGLQSGILEVSGAKETVLHPAVTRVLGQDIIDAADAVLSAALELDDDSDVEFEPSGSQRAMLVPPGRVSMDLSAKLRDGVVHHSSAVVEVAILVDHTPFKVVRVPYRLRRFHRVLVAAKAIDKGEPLGEDNLALRRVEAPAATTPFLTDFDSVRQKVASRKLQAGAKLSLRSISDPAVIYSGDQINLVAVHGRVRVAARAIALQDGAVGERITVRNLSSSKVVQATVHGMGLAVIQL